MPPPGTDWIEQKPAVLIAALLQHFSRAHIIMPGGGMPPPYISHFTEVQTI